MNITVLCKIVDNFGDIGVVYRLINRMKQIAPDKIINLVVDELPVFKKICPEIKENEDLQSINGINVYKWHSDDFCYKEFKKSDGEKMEVILECFQCGRPSWMEKILFEDKLIRTVNIVMIDYLTAEDYAEDFHCLQSLTRSAKVKKVNFMPGFTEKTGGLIIDSPWNKKIKWNAEGDILFFCYDKSWAPVAAAIERCKKDNFLCSNSKVLIAQGKGKETITEAFSNADYKKQLDYLNQSDWDLMMQNCSVLFIRGEESMSRACLSGIPFIWQAYPQSEEYQMVKVKALLKRMSRHFTPEDFSIVEKVWLDFNTEDAELNPDTFEKNVYEFIKNKEKLLYGFQSFAEDLRKIGDLTEKLMTFINKNYIM